MSEQAGARVLCCRSAAELRGRDPKDLGRWGTMLSLDNEARCTTSHAVPQMSVSRGAWSWTALACYPSQ